MSYLAERRRPALRSPRRVATHSAEEKQVLQYSEVNEQHVMLRTQSQLLARLPEVCRNVPAADFRLATAGRVHPCKEWRLRPHLVCS